MDVPPAGVPALGFDKGTLTFPGDSPPTPHFRYDPREGVCRAQALDYRAIVRVFKEAGVRFRDEVFSPFPLERRLVAPAVELRDYQREALEAWMRTGRRGVVVMPTGAGKTILAVKAIQGVNEPTLVVVPTLDLVDQWRGRLARAFNVPVGVVAGGETRLEALTVTTYDSAYLHASRWGDKFPFVVFDEVHHLPSEGYRHIAEMLAAPWRLGLTATYERGDDLHEELPRLTGEKVFEVEAKALAGKHLSTFTTKRIYTDLTRAEREAYERHHKVYRDLLMRRKEFRGREGHKRLIMRSGSSPEARRALIARERARDVMMNSEEKLRVLAELLEAHRGERTLVFTEHNRLVHEISRRFLVPAVTHRTGTEERPEVLEKFRRGDYPVVVTSKVLDEGVDVPEATVGIILSGSGSRREFTQRLGRLLRPGNGKHAHLYEIVSRETTEEKTSQRRNSRGDSTGVSRAPGSERSGQSPRSGDESRSDDWGARQFGGRL